MFAESQNNILTSQNCPHFHCIYLNNSYIYLLKYFAGNKNVYAVEGGADRNATIRNIVSSAEKQLHLSEDDIIITHDAVRPFVTNKMISDSINALEHCQICTAAVPMTDTVVYSENGITADQFPDRSQLRSVQTPQTFRLASFKEVYGSIDTAELQKATDVCSLYQRKGYEVCLIDGNSLNIKITYPCDYELAKLIARDFDN